MEDKQDLDPTRGPGGLLGEEGAVRGRKWGEGGERGREDGGVGGGEDMEEGNGI